MPKLRRNRSRQTGQQQLTLRLDQAHALIARGRLAEAADMLAELAREHPEHVGVQATLANVAYDQRDAPLFLIASERLGQLLPDDAAVTLQLAGAYLLNNRPVLALRTFRRFVQRWPNHEDAPSTRQTIARLEAGLGEVLAEIDLEGDDALDVAALHEEVQSLLYTGRYAEGRAAAARLLQRAPHFAPALNNLSLIYALEGQLDQAIATAERVLAFDPDNIHALANLIRFACLGGRVDQAREWAARLKRSTADAVDRPLKIMEALSFLGDDQGVLEAFQDADQARRREREPLPALLPHLAAVATMRLGDTDEARRLWRRALRAEPGFGLAQSNVDDLRRPVGERHAPWPFSMQYWIDQATATELSKAMPPAGGDDQAITEALRSFLEAHPHLEGVVPLLLDHGDPQAREFALRLAVQAKSPPLLAALRDFALSQRGPDQLRLEAAQHASEAGLLPKGLVRMWMGGEWREAMLLSFELHEEPPGEHTPEVMDWLDEALTLLRRGDAAGAEPLLQQALAVEPDAPDLVNNLAVAFERQGRHAEAAALLQQNFERHPDYVLGCIAMARLHLNRGELEDARSLLNSLLSRRRLHFDDLAALAAAQIDLYLAEDQPEGARSWIELWASVDSDNPSLAHYRRRLRGIPGRRAPARPKERAERRPRSTPAAEGRAESPAASKQSESSESVPKPMRPLYEQIVGFTDAFCREHLDEEYAALCRKMTATLSRKRPSPLLQGRPQSWACAILYAVGRINFLFDRSQTPHLSATELCSLCGVSQATASAKAKQILDSLKVRLMDPRWSRRSLVDKSPLAWMVEVDGLIVDARDLPRELQEEAFRRGLIPYLPESES